jgi:AcrR family transcriptional regulator
MNPSASLRERTRNAVRAELSDVAQRLFVEQGYEVTTVDSIAEAAGLSKRSFFRYFASKEDLVLGKYEVVAERIAEALADRPVDEGAWESLRRAFDGVVGYVDDPTKRAATEEMQRVVQSTPTLRAGYLEKFDRMVERVASTLDARVGRPAGPPPSARSRAVVAAAFACLQAAEASYLASPEVTYATHLDEAMAAVRAAES